MPDQKCLKAIKYNKIKRISYISRYLKKKNKSRKLFNANYKTQATYIEVNDIAAFAKVQFQIKKE